MQLELSKLIVSVLSYGDATGFRSSRVFFSLVARVHLRQWPNTKTGCFEHATSVVCVPVCACIAQLQSQRAIPGEYHIHSISCCCTLSENKNDYSKQLPFPALTLTLTCGSDTGTLYNSVLLLPIYGFK